MNISNFHLHEERKINQNHLPGTFAYFPTMQSIPLEMRGMIQKISPNTPARTSSAWSYSNVLNSVWSYQEKKAAPLISGFQNVIFLIWLEECIHVITIISSLIMCIGGSRSWCCHAENDEWGVYGRGRGVYADVKQLVGHQKSDLAPCVWLQHVCFISSLRIVRGSLMQTSVNVCIM